MEFKFEIPTDSDGYYSLECPFCDDTFKLPANDWDKDEVYELFCPYCGLVDDKNTFVPQQIIEHSKDIAANYLKEMVNKSFKKTKRNLRGSNLKFEYKPLKKETPGYLLENDDELHEINLVCCNKSIKVNLNFDYDIIYCPYCGVN